MLDSNDALRFTSDFVTAHLRGIRGGGSVPDPGGIDPRVSFDEAPWFMDSLERVTLAGMMTEALQVQHSGLEDLFLARRSLADWSEIASTSLQEYSDEIVFFTSGSTGKPRSTAHRTALLHEEVGELARQLPAGRKRIVSLVPAHHIYGFLFTLLLPQQLGVPCVRLDGVHPRLQPGDIVVAVPTWIQEWNRSGFRLPQDCSVVSSTAPLPAADGQQLVKQGVHLMEVFGSSETAGIGVRHNAKDGFALLPYWELVEQESALQRAGLSEPVALPDHLSWLSDRFFSFAGRRDAAVQVGGINVYPDHIAARFRELPQVAEATVRPFESPAGTRLKVFIVPENLPRVSTTETVELEQTLRQWSAQNLSGPQRPVRYRFGAQLPRNRMGKPADF